jgi:outer membrane lipoprotein carrier protein
MTRARLAVLAGLAGAFLATPSPASPQALPSAADLAARVQARYASVRDFTADFTVTQTGGIAMKGVGTDRGTVAIKKPGRMRWVFQTGSHQQMISDGATIYSYFPDDKYVQPTPMPRDDRASSGLLLLSGRGDITRDFVPTLPSRQPEGEWRLTLTPKTHQDEFDTLTLAVDRTTLQLRGFEVADGQGGVQTFRFSNLRENQGLKDALFEFKMPKGVVIRN